MKRKIIILLHILILVLGCKAPKLMSHKEFSKIDNLGLPRITTFKTINKEILYFGAYHSNVINDSLFPLIESKFKEFKPNFILHEGGSNWPIYKDRDSTIIISGEPGYIIQLAQENNIAYETIEPEERLEYKYLLNIYEMEWVVLMYLCRQIDNQQRLSKSFNISDAQFNQSIIFFLEKLVKDDIPLNKNQMNFAYWKGTYKRLLGKELNWRNFNPDLYYPNRYLTLLNEINRASDTYRNSYMVQKILSTSNKFDRIMVLVGGGHLIIQEALLEHKLKKMHH